MPWPRCSISRSPGSRSPRRQREWSRTHCRLCASERRLLGLVPERRGARAGGASGDRPQTIAEFRAALGIPSITSDGDAMARPAPSPAAPSYRRADGQRLAGTGSTPRVGVPEPDALIRTGGRIGGDAAVASVPEQPSPTLPSRAAIGSSLGAAPWKLVAPLIVVGLVLIVVGLARSVFSSGLWASLVLRLRNRGPRLVDAADSDRRAAEPARRNAGSTDRECLGAGCCEILPLPTWRHRRRSARRWNRRCRFRERQTTPAASAPPAPRTGKIQFSIKPWGEIIVDGKTRGVSPPIKELSIPEGRHRIEIRNGTFPGYESEVDIKAGSSGSISYSFKAP